MKICEICKKTIPEDEVFEVNEHMENSRKSGASANGATTFFRKANFGRNATSEASADSAFPPSAPGARNYG